MRAAICLCGTEACRGSFLAFSGASRLHTVLRQQFSATEIGVRNNKELECLVATLVEQRPKGNRDHDRTETHAMDSYFHPASL